MTPSEAMSHDWITGLYDPPPPTLRSTLSSRNSLNPSPTAASSRNSRLSGVSSGAGSSAAVHGTSSSVSGMMNVSSYRRKNSDGNVPSTSTKVLNKSKMTSPKNTNSSVSIHTKALSATIVETRTKENDGDLKPRSNSNASNAQPSKSPSAYAAATLKQAASAVVQSIKGSAGRISAGANRRKTPTSQKTETDTSKKISNQHESVSPSQNAKLPPVFPSAQTTSLSRSSNAYSSIGQHANQQLNNFSQTPIAPSPSSTAKRGMFTQNIPITITGGGVVNIHNLNGTTTTFMPGQQLPSVNIHPIGYSQSGVPGTVKPATNPQTSNRMSGYYANSSNIASSPTSNGLPAIRNATGENVSRAASVVSRNGSSRAGSSAKRNSQNNGINTGAKGGLVSASPVEAVHRDGEGVVQRRKSVTANAAVRRLS
ncbi:hypothetical protein HK096_001308, partial [Nowakowskiella sp. JEL0078]